MTTQISDQEILRVQARFQMKCLVCGEGMVVTKRGIAVDPFNQLTLQADGKLFPIHRQCIGEEIAARIAQF